MVTDFKWYLGKSQIGEKHPRAMSSLRITNTTEEGSSAFEMTFFVPAGRSFQKMYNLGMDFEVVFTRKTTGQIIQMLEAENLAGKTNWNIVSHLDKNTFLRWIDEGYLLKYQPQNIGNIREVFHDETGFRFPAFVGSPTCA